MELRKGKLMKRTKKKMEIEVPATRTVCFKIETGLHRRLKMESAVQVKTMVQLLVEYIEAGLSGKEVHTEKKVTGKTL